MNLALLLSLIAAPTMPVSTDDDIEIAVAVAWAWKTGVQETPPAKPELTTYAQIRKRVESGERVTFTTPISGFTGLSGTYDCWLQNGQPVMERREEVKPSASPFAGTTGATTPRTGARTAVTSPPRVVVRGSSGGITVPSTATIAPFAVPGGSIDNCPT